MAQVDLGAGAIGGKDSMSGTFEQLDVPPTLISFAVAVGNMKRATSPEFKGAGHRVVRIAPRYKPMASRQTRMRCWRCSPRLRSLPISATRWPCPRRATAPPPRRSSR